MASYPLILRLALFVGLIRPSRRPAGEQARRHDAERREMQMQLALMVRAGMADPFVDPGSLRALQEELEVVARIADEGPPVQN